MIVAVAVLATGTDVTVKLEVVTPAGTVTLAGTVAADVLLLVSVTTAPPLGADAVRVTVPVERLPPITVPGFRDTEETVAGGVTVIVAVLVVPVG